VSAGVRGESCCCIGRGAGGKQAGGCGWSSRQRRWHVTLTLVRWCCVQGQGVNSSHHLIGTVDLRGVGSVAGRKFCMERGDVGFLWLAL